VLRGLITPIVDAQSGAASFPCRSHSLGPQPRQFPLADRLEPFLRRYLGGVYAPLEEQLADALATAMGVQEEPDRRWRDFLNARTEYNRGTRQIGAWMREALPAMGVKPASIPADTEL